MADLLRVSLVGAMPNGEEWSVNPVFRIGGDFGAPVSPTQAQTIATAIAAVAIPTSLTVANATSVSFNGARVEARMLNGTLESLAEAIKPTPTFGTGGNAHPFQTAIVSSLRTGTPGASGRGRLYWPATAIAIQTSTLRPATATITSTLSGVKTLLSGVQAAIDVTLDGVSLCVWSRSLNSTANVTSVQMGDVLDTQRRRRDVLVEGYSSLAYP
jgi:hypothetical protein